VTLPSWGRGTWPLLILAAAVVVAYFGIVGSVHDLLETELRRTATRVGQVGAKVGQVARVGRVGAGVKKLANQPRVADKFRDPFEGRVEAHVILFLFMFLSPITVVMATTLLLFLLAVCASVLAPLVGSDKIAMLIAVVGFGGLAYVQSARWLPHASYVLGLVARAYIVATQAG
jgi:hypothetical protein